jgi:hypothetical protein
MRELPVPHPYRCHWHTATGVRGVGIVYARHPYHAVQVAAERWPLLPVGSWTLERLSPAACDAPPVACDASPVVLPPVTRGLTPGQRKWRDLRRRKQRAERQRSRRACADGSVSPVTLEDLRRATPDPAP